MTLAAGLAIILFGLCGGLHARAMAFAMHLTDRKHITGTGALLIALYVLAAAHIAEAGLYAVGFFIGESTGIGGFAQSEALLHKSAERRGSPFPGQTYPTASVTGMPSAV